MVLSSFLSTTRNACVCIFMTRVYTGLCLDGHIHMQNGTYTKWLTTEAIPKIIERFEPFAYCLQRHTPWPSDLHRHTHTHDCANTHTHTHVLQLLSLNGQASGLRDGLILHTCEHEGPRHWQHHKVVAKHHFIASRFKPH